MGIISCKCVFKTELNGDYTLDWLKASLVVKGFHQVGGVNYIETFSPVIKPNTIQIIPNLTPINRNDIQ